MKKFDFAHSQKSWDRYSCFYARTGPFVEFETGELMLDDSRPSPGDRGLWEKYNIFLTATIDKNCPALYHEFDKDFERPIPQAWLKQGGCQYLAVDYERNIAVRVGGGLRSKQDEIAPRFLSSCYWPKEKVMPMGWSSINVAAPNGHFRKIVGPKIREAQAAVAAIVRIDGSLEHQAYHWEVPWEAPTDWVNKSVVEIVADVEEVIAYDIAKHQAHATYDTRVQQLHNFAHLSVKYPRDVLKFDHLFVKPR